MPDVQKREDYAQNDIRPAIGRVLQDQGQEAMIKGISQKSAINTNIPALICISPSCSIAAGSMKANTLWADIATAIKSHSTEILTFQVKRSIFASFVFAAVSPNLKINEPSN